MEKIRKMLSRFQASKVHMVKIRRSEPSGLKKVFLYGWPAYSQTHTLSNEQLSAGRCIVNCRTIALGFSKSVCDVCGYEEIHYNSCRNRNCSLCQSTQKEIWIAKRKAEVIDAPYFHLVFTLPAELNPLMYANQKVLYALLHTCAAQTVLELSEDPKYLGATPGLIQVLHTWGQELNYHPHVHQIATGAGLTKNGELKVCSGDFFIPAKVLAKKFRGKFLEELKRLYDNIELDIPPSCEELADLNEWSLFIDKLYKKQWCPEIKATFNGKGNAIEYLGRYANRIAITDARILNVTEESVTFKAKNYKNNGAEKIVTLPIEEFIRRYLQHVLPKGFQKIRYFGFLNNRSRKKNLEKIFRLQGRKQPSVDLDKLSVVERLKQIWGVDITLCPMCGNNSVRVVDVTYGKRLLC